MVGIMSARIAMLFISRNDQEIKRVDLIGVIAKHAGRPFFVIAYEEFCLLSGLMAFARIGQ